MNYYIVEFTGVTGIVWCKKMQLTWDGGETQPGNYVVSRYFNGALTSAEKSAIMEGRMIVQEVTKQKFDSLKDE